MVRVESLPSVWRRTLTPSTAVRAVRFRGTGEEYRPSPTPLLRYACGETPEESVKLGWAHGALATTFPGDTTMARLSHVRAFAKGGSARIQH